MVKICTNTLKAPYSCNMWIKSTDTKNLDRCRGLLPPNYVCKRLALDKRRFTLLRSPLGNKKFKDQYEHCEYGVFIAVKSVKASTILSFLGVVFLMPGVKIKILASKLPTRLV